MALSQLQFVSNRFRRQLLRQERGAATQLVKAYGDAWLAIKGRLDAFTAKIEDAINVGEDVGPSWLFQQARYFELLAQTAYEINAVADLANKNTLNGQRWAVEQAQQAVADLVDFQMGAAPTGVTLTWAKLPSHAFEQLVGTLQNGSPLRHLFDEFGPQASEAMQRTLVQGIAIGQGPREIAAVARRETGMSLNRALTISRTEVLRSYRDSAILNYQANRDVVTGWRWSASLSDNSCFACIYLDGSIHDVDEMFSSHPRCKCTPVPVTRSWRDMGFDVAAKPVAWQSGADWFTELPAERQLVMMGAAKYEAWTSGKIDLSDLVAERYSREWGLTRSEASLKQALANHASGPTAQAA